jgi:hypothetical protein
VRKRIVIASITVIGAAVLVYVASQPKEGTVEGHKREYIAAWRRVNRKTLPEKAKQLFERIAGRKSPPWHFTAEDNQRMQVHRAALLEMGYLSQREFELTNCSSTQVFLSPAFASAHKREHKEFFMILGAGPNRVHIIAVAEEMPLFAEAVRKTEMQEK